MGELIFNAGMLLFLILMTFYSGQIEIWNGDLGARIYPMCLLIIGDVIFLIKTIGVVKNLPSDKNKRKLFVNMDKKTIIRLLLAFLAIILYAVLMTRVGFFIATALYAAAMSAILGLRNIPKLILASLAITLIIYIIFVWLLGISVPRGAGQLYYFGLWLETLF